MIELNEFSFPAEDYFRLALRRALGRFGWIFAYVCSITGFTMLPAGNAGTWAVMMISFGILILLSAYVAGRRYVYAKENAAIYQKRKMTFDAGMGHYVCEDGTEAKFPLTQVSRVMMWRDYYLLYVTKNNFVPVLRGAFASEDDRRRFEAEVVRGKMKKSGFVKYVVIYLVITAALMTVGFMAPRGQKVIYIEADNPAEYRL